MPSLKDENYGNFRNYQTSSNNRTKIKLKDDSLDARNNLNGLNCKKDNFSMNYAKNVKPSCIQNIAEQRTHFGMHTTRPANKSSSIDTSQKKNQRKRLKAPGTKDSSGKAKKIDKTKNIDVNVVVLELGDYHEKPNLLCREHAEYREPRKPKPSRTCATQTLYRESSAQTLPYLPEVSNNLEELEDVEIFKLPTILPGDGPPGLYEVEVLERARKRWAFLKSIKENMQHKQKAARQYVEYMKQKHILTAFEWEHWIEREEYIQECQLLRLEILIRMFNDRERHFRATSNERLQMSCKRIEMERQAALNKNAINFARSLRVLNGKRDKQPRVWHKEPIINELAYPGSEFYAPKMRYGVNPNRRHGQLSRKGFDMRMDDLEKQAINMDPKKLKCRFAKIRTWSKPKQPLQEFEQNFCSEDNLNALYESLRNLRLGAKRERVTPQCLRVKKVQTSKSVVAEEKLIDIKQVVLYEYADEDSNADKDNNVDLEQQVSELSNTISAATSTSISEQNLQDLHDRTFSEEIKLNQFHEKQQNEFCTREMQRENIENLLLTYEGSTIGWLMRFLSEEMVRIKEQRKLHFFCMLAQRERWHREAVEAGLRQKENCMRATYEKLYEECDSTNIEIAEKYLQDIMNTDIADYAHQDAENRVIELAKTVDKDIESLLQSFNEVQTPLNSASLRCSLRAIVMSDKKEMLCRLVKTEIVKYIINDVLLANIFEKLEPYDIATAIIDDLIDRLIDNDLYLFSTECSSLESDYVPEYSAEAQHEAKAIIRKLIKQSVPGRRWRNSTECLVNTNINDLLDDIFNIEATKEFIYEDETQTPHLASQPSFANILQTDSHKRPFYSEESSISVTERTISVQPLNGNEPIWGLETTKDLSDSEHLLIIDPDVLSVDNYETNYTAYKRVRPFNVEISLIHNIPSAHTLLSYPEFSKTPVYAPSSDEDEEEANKRRSESILSEARGRMLYIASEYEEQGELISDVEMYDTEGEAFGGSAEKLAGQDVIEGEGEEEEEEEQSDSKSSCEHEQHLQKRTITPQAVGEEKPQETQTLPQESTPVIPEEESEMKVNTEHELSVEKPTEQEKNSLKESPTMTVDETNPNESKENEDTITEQIQEGQTVLEENKSSINEEPILSANDENEVTENQQPEVTTSAEDTIHAVENNEEKLQINEEELKINEPELTTNEA